MRALILGGTRFAGRQFATELIRGGAEVTVSSRRPERAPNGAKVRGGERSEAIAVLSKEPAFDVIVDFTAYNAESVREALSAFPSGKYLLISSIWVTKLAERSQACQGLLSEASPSDFLLPVTRRYIEGKAGAETAVLEASAKGRIAASIRLPIMWGEGDHTGRLAFYRKRVRDRGGLILVDGGYNQAQISYCGDIVKVLLSICKAGLEGFPSLMEALPDERVSVRNILDVIISAENCECELHDLPARQLAIDLPAYIEVEPLWRESRIAVTSNNAYSLTNTSCTSIQRWLPSLIANEDVLSERYDPLRDAELNYIHNMKRFLL